MPIDYQQVSGKIKQIGADARPGRKKLEEKRARANGLLHTHASNPDFLRSRLDSARAIDANIRCASPLDESLVSSCPPPASVEEATLIAADGSQVNPDRHAALQFGLINVGALVMKLKSGQAPEIYTQSELFYGDELEDSGLTSEGAISLRRDLSERVKVEEISRDLKGQVVALTDGTIEIWGAKDIEDARAYRQSVQAYLSILSRLQSRGVVTAGYVDKPSADLVVRLLELALATPEDLKQLRAFHPLRGVSDRWLFGQREAPLLPPGHRSAVFLLQSGSEKNYKGLLALHFFYLNVGTQGHPWPVRVEIPKWVADDRGKLDLLHALLVEQCRMLGSRPYPYLLHRAHETALVKNDEKLQIEQMLAQELRRQGVEVDEGSYKQSAKDLKGRTRM